MPPIIGAAMGFMMSDPTPVLQRIGTRAAITTLTVISFGRSRTLLIIGGLGKTNIPANVGRGGIDVHIARQLPALISNHRRPWSQGNLRQLPKRDLGARRRLDEDALKVRQRVAKALFIPDVDGIA